MSRIVRSQRQKRGFFGTIFKWLFILFNVAMAIILLIGLANVGEIINKAGSEAERGGAAIGVTLGVGFVLFFWVAGAVILGLLTLVTRSSKIIVIEEEVSKLAFLLLIIAASPALAADLPHWDAQDQCERQLRAVGQTDNAFLLNACLEQEQNAYNVLKTAWPKILPEIANVCSKQMSAVAQYSYFLLNACVDQQLEASGKSKNFKFKY